MKRIRSGGLLLAIVGAIIVVWAPTSFDYFGYNPPLIIGASILCFGLVTLFRRKGDFDDFDDGVVDDEADDGGPKETRDPE